MVSIILAANLFVVPRLSILQDFAKKSLDVSPVAIAACDVDGKSKECVVELIKKYANFFDVSEKLALDIADCESDFRVDAYGDGGRAYGPYQFHEKTFKLFSKKLGEKLDYFDLEDNIRLAIWALANDKGHHWSCYKKVVPR